MWLQDCLKLINYGMLRIGGVCPIVCVAASPPVPAQRQAQPGQPGGGTFPLVGSAVLGCLEQSVKQCRQDN